MTINVIVPTVTPGPDGTIIKWSGLMGGAITDDCDVGEAVEVSSYGDRSIQLGGPWTFGSGTIRMVMDFNSDPGNMLWIGVVPLGNFVNITPGRSYGAALVATWPLSKFIRPRIVPSTYTLGVGVDVLMLCLNKAV